MAALLYRLGHLCVRHRRIVLVTWIALLFGIGAINVAAGGKTVDSFNVPGTESQRAIDLLEARFPAESGSSTQVVLSVPSGSLTDHQAAIDEAMARAAEVEGVAMALGPDETQMLSPDGRIGLGSVRYPLPGVEVATETGESVAEALAPLAEAGVTVEYGGEVVPGYEEEIGGQSELIGLGVAVIVLLVSFGSLLAMGLPILTALLGLGIGMSLIGLVSALVELSSSAPTLAVMIGLAVGIDYALFVVTRHRQNLALGLSVEESAARANATAGGAVVFAGVTVIIAISSLAIIGIPFLTVMGLAAAVTVAIAVIVAITLLPAMLGFAGHSIDRFGVPGMRRRTGGADEGETLGSRWAKTVTHSPVRSLVLGLVVMGVLAAPALAMRLGMPDAGTEPTSSTQRRAYDLVSEGFGPGFNGQLTIVADLSGVDDPQGAVEALSGRLAQVDGIVEVLPANFNEAGDTAVLSAVPTTGPSDKATDELVTKLRHEIRDEVRAATGADYYVAGLTAILIDISHKMGSALLPFMVLVIGLTLVLLMAVFRSVLVPIKAAIAILVSIASSFGVVVAVFNWGWLAGLIGLEQTIPVVSFLPLMMFAILFGLSMDYEVFIMSRIHEEYHRTGKATDSVLVGLSASARVITAAAVIMISVFGAFALGDSPIIKMFGVALATAVFLDATVVRMVIVPSVMTLFGDRAWKLPAWLDKVLPNLDVEGEGLMEELEAKDRAAAEAKAAAQQAPEPAGV